MNGILKTEDVENQLQCKPQPSELAKESVIERQRKDYMKPGFSWHRTYRGCFFDESKLVILLNGFQKKTQKTPLKEIEKAGTKKSYISKLENGKGNIQLSTLIRIFEQGLNKKLD